MQHKRQHNPVQKLLGALVCLCMLVQPSLLPLHLAIVEHCYGTAKTAVDVATHDHSHPHGHPHEHPHILSDDLGESHGDQGDSHPPHPGEDYHREAQELGTPPSSDIEFFAYPVSAVVVWDVAPSAVLSPLVPRATERSPPRASAQSRAPPATV